MENIQTCPYTGLRSFSEDESLYFKGREEDIDQATSQLQRNKFLMLTGASGDGKSSLVYAGIIPNARAGFLKSKYTNWCVAHFRPERTPFENLCTAIGKQLDIPNTQTVQGELNHGFSALVDLYRNSKRNVDMRSDAWLQAGDREKAVLKREGANLIILVDQFEEFFTNPENYHHGAPSRDANLVLNLLLETARIALDEDIPIYVIFTMRSDYIGQCAAFRGLPEYIGFSQFFVPRLNRTQLQQVIEEPATLNGNQISRRLTERLIHDITEGVDQLPILQHALKQIWLAADYGNEELDLIHYAMVGGMAVSELPEEQVELYKDWFKSLTPEIQACYHAPGLQNVLDTHTNKLYQQADNYYKEQTGKEIPEADAKMIIRTAFTCLTKIDQGRAVRNRMTLLEITNILGNTDYNEQAVGQLLNIFREPANTFINPFISEEDPESRKLQSDTVLDITHESLIRNWQYLGQWAKEEFESHAVSLDFEKQLNRWIESGRSDNFLLSIGPLTYFENWYKKARPNAWWIARYLPEETSRETKLTTSKAILGSSMAFIDRSASKHIITRTIMRYGPKRIAAVLGIIAVLLLSSFAISNHFKKQNSYVLSSIHQQTLKLTADPRVYLYSKVLLVAEELRLGQTTVDEVVNAIPDSLLKISFASELAAQLILQGKDQPREEIYRSLTLTDSLLAATAFPVNNPARISAIMNEINLFRVVLEMAYFRNPNEQMAGWRKRNARRSADWVLKIIADQPAGFNDVQNLTIALEHAINYQVFTNDEQAKLITKLSPFENGLQTEWLKSNFQKEKLLVRGAQAQGYGFFYNGLFQELAYLYAASANSDKTLRCMDSLLKYSQNNYAGDFSSNGDNATNIAAVYFSHGSTDSAAAFINGYCTRKKISPVQFYDQLMGRTIHDYVSVGNLRMQAWMDEVRNLNLLFSSAKQISLTFKQNRELINATIQNQDERNFQTALTYKNEGILKSLLDKEEPFHRDEYFDKAVSYYNQVSPAYLEEMIHMVDQGTSDQMIAPRKLLFIFPDIRTTFHPEEPRGFFHFYINPDFMEYMVDRQLLVKFYSGPAEWKYLPSWLEAYNTNWINTPVLLNRKPALQQFKNLEAALDKKAAGKSVDLNLLYLYLGKEAQDSGRLDEMLGYYDKIEVVNIFNSLRSKDFGGFVRDQAFRMIASAVEGYAKANQLKKAAPLIAMFKNPVNRSSLYAYAAIHLLRGKADSKLAQPLLDSAIMEITRMENVTGEQPNRRLLAYALMMQDPDRNKTTAYAIIRNLPVKYAAFQDICRAYAFHDRLFDAQENIPAFNSGSDQADFLRNILMGWTEGNKNTEEKWREYSDWSPQNLNKYILYVDENS